MNWTAIFSSAIAGAIVSWPVFAAGIWLGQRKIRGHVSQVTNAQTQQVTKLTNAQTAMLLGRVPQTGGTYHGHGGDDVSRHPGPGSGHPRG